MPEQTDTAVSTASYNQWRLRNSSSKVRAVRTNDGDSSVLYATSSADWKWQSFNFSPIEGIDDPVNDATLTALAREQSHGTGAQSFKLIWGGGSVPTTQYGYGTFIGVFGTKNYYTCVAGDGDPGFSLTAARTNGEHGFWMRGTGGYRLYVTYLARYVDFDYTSSDQAGPFTHNIATLAAAAIGAGLLLRDMPALAQYMARWVGNRSWKLRPDEYEKALRVWNEYCHPRFVFLGVS